MWFLRDLIVIIMLTPAIRLLVKTMKWSFPLLLICVYLFYSFNVTGMSSSTLFWFGMGSWFAIKGKNLFAWIECFNGNLLLVVWISTLITTIISFYYDWHYETVHSIFGIIHFMAIYKCVSAISTSGIPKWLTAVSTASFFIYAFHEPWMGYVLKISYKVLHPSGDVYKRQTKGESLLHGIKDRFKYIQTSFEDTLSNNGLNEHTHPHPQRAFFFANLTSHENNIIKDVYKRQRIGLQTVAHLPDMVRFHPRHGRPEGKGRPPWDSQDLP